MKYRTRIYYTETDKALMWERWRQGESLHAIARLFGRSHSAIRRRSCSEDWRDSTSAATAFSRRALDAVGAGRDLARPVCAGLVGFGRSHASLSSRPPCTGEPRGPIVTGADDRYTGRSDADRGGVGSGGIAPRRCKLAREPCALARHRGRASCGSRWSPAQSGRVAEADPYPDDENAPGVTRDDLSSSLFIQARGALKKELAAAPAGRTRGMRRSRQSYAARVPAWVEITDDRLDPRTAGRGRKTGPCPATGRATCSSAATTVRSLRWWSAIRVT